VSHARGVEEPRVHDRDVLREQRERAAERRVPLRVEPRPDRGRPRPSAAEAAAAEEHGRVDGGGPEPAVRRRALEERDVRGQPGEAREVHGDPLELEPDGAPRVHLRTGAQPRERLERLAVRPRVGDARVARDRLDERRERPGVAREEQALDAAVLVPEVDLQVVDGLAEAHEPEVPRLDDAGVDRADRHLVHLRAVDGVERVPIHPARLRAREPHRLQPRVIVRLHAVRLEDLPLEDVQRREVPGQRVEALVPRDRRPRRGEAPAVLEHGRERQRRGVVRRLPMERDDVRAGGELRAEAVEEVPRLGAELRDGDEQGRRGHSAPSPAATCRNSALTGAGR
jgi:hypothetical protein